MDKLNKIYEALKIAKLAKIQALTDKENSLKNSELKAKEEAKTINEEVLNEINLLKKKTAEEIEEIELIYKQKIKKLNEDMFEKSKKNIDQCYKIIIDRIIYYDYKNN